LQVLLRHPPNPEQKKWLETRLKEMLELQGIGRGTASGFGRLAADVPKGIWEIKLRGMKPCIQQHKTKARQVTQEGKYRWSPQVLRACLRGYFTRLALSVLSSENTIKLTDKIFGGLGSPAQLVLTSFLLPVEKARPGEIPRESFTNIQAEIALQIWPIQVNCKPQFQKLIGALLELASRLGGLGPGWRRPPHTLERFNGFRGSEFTVTSTQPDYSFNGLKLGDLIDLLKGMVRDFAQADRLPLLAHPVAVSGCIRSIWQGKTEQWRDIVHGVCRSTNNPKRPNWCGNSETRPSGYAVRQYEDYCLITVFDPAVEAALGKFEKVWG
jgi:hypothetical protein